MVKMSSMCVMSALIGCSPVVLATEAPATVNDQIAKVQKQLVGSWKSTEAFEDYLDAEGNVKDVHMLMSVAPVEIEGLDNTMYAESVRSNMPWVPFRQSIFQLYDYKGKVRLRTFTIAMSPETLGLYSGFTATPEHFPEISLGDLIPTLDVELTTSPTGFAGSTPYPYPTTAFGAVEMTSTISFDGEVLTTSDRGYDAEGTVVWGADENEKFSFEKSHPYTEAEVRENGMIMIYYPSTRTDKVVQDKDQMHVHYTGYLPDGTIFDSSIPRSVPFVFEFPPGQRAIVGWGIGMVDFTENEHRKFVIPGDLGYGKRGNPRANIPGDSPLIFNTHLIQIDRPEPVPEPVSEPASTQDAEAGHDHSHDDGHDHSHD